MSWSFTIAKVAGTKVRIHFTFLILLAWIGLYLYQNSGLNAALHGLAFIFSLFGCVLLHEFGHAFAARSFGIRTPTITLLPFGGLASIERIPKKPYQEIVIALAGPFVNVVIVAILWLTRGLGPTWHWAPVLETPVPMAQQLLGINIMLVLFNLLPVFPMDGGRVFRAGLALFLPWVKATEIAAISGQALSIVGGVLAISGPRPNLFLLLIAVFIFFAAGAEANAARTDNALSDLSALQAAESEFHTVRADQPLSVAVDFLLSSAQHNYPVVDREEACVGILTQNALLRHLSQSGPDSRIEDAMQRQFPLLTADMSALAALRAVQQANLPAAPLLSAGGRITHWFTVDNLTDLILTQTALRQYSPEASLASARLAH